MRGSGDDPDLSPGTESEEMRSRLKIRLRSPPCPEYGRFRGQPGLVTDNANPSNLTQTKHR